MAHMWYDELTPSEVVRASYYVATDARLPTAANLRTHLAPNRFSLHLMPVTPEHQHRDTLLVKRDHNIFFNFLDILFLKCPRYQTV